MAYLAEATYDAIRTDPSKVVDYYNATRSSFVAELGMPGLSEDALKAAWCATVAYGLAPYGAGPPSIDLVDLLASKTLECSSYVTLTWRLFAEFGLPTDSLTAIGWDGGAVGNHAQLLFDDGVSQLLLDPTIALVVNGVTFEGLIDGVSYDDQWSGYSRSDISAFNALVSHALADGDYDIRDLLYFRPTFAVWKSTIALGHTFEEGNDVQTVVGSPYADVIDAGVGDDTIYAEAGDDDINGGAGADYMEGGVGNDTFHVDDAGDRVVELAGEGTDTVYSTVDYVLTNNVENLFLEGSISGMGNSVANVIHGDDGASNFISGLAGDDTLLGLGGDDALDGGAGADTMEGGLGNDTFRVDNAGDKVAELAGEGNDAVYATIDYVLTDNVENLFLEGAVRGTGNGEDNLIYGDDRTNNIIAGLDGDDRLFGLDGDDVLDGGAGADHMEGGLGDDTFNVDDAGDEVVELAGQGVDTVYSTIDYVLADNVENLVLKGAVSGTGNSDANKIYGDAGDNILVGLNGDDVLDGGAGADAMDGGLGDDTFHVDDAGDQVVELAGEGLDTVHSTIDYVLTANVENLVLEGAVSGTGNDEDNLIYGDDRTNNIIAGLDGDDSLHGRGGDDILDGGAGADHLEGGLGNDTFHVDDAGDQVVELAGQGVDTVYSTIDYVLTDNVENLVLDGAVSGTGNGGANEIYGDDRTNNIIAGLGGNDHLYGLAGDDLLDGGAGADTMEGGLGSDTYYVDNAGDHIIELAGEGVDVVHSTVSFILSDNVDNLVLDGAISGTGNDEANEIYGDDRTNNIIAGLGGNDHLYGLGGDDLLDGGAGADTMEGGLGNDTYYVDNAGDRVIELAGQGVDAVHASISYVLPDTIEDLFLEGAVSGTGNSAANSIYGGLGNNTLSGLAGDDRLFGFDGDDVLNGGAGADYMEGGVGNDTYYVDNKGDQVVELAGQGSDTVRSTISYVMPDNVDYLFISGVIYGTGNNSANLIYGDGGNNIIAGLGGNDILYGLGGDDLLSGGADNDTLWGGAGSDVLWGLAGSDYFYWESLSETGPSAGTSDLVMDFSKAQGDILWVAPIDADETVAGNQSFTFIGTDSFSAAGQIRWTIEGAETWIWLNVDNDLNPDGLIRLSGVTTPNADWFNL